MSIETPIHNFLIEYNKKNRVRCHMPGSKGRDFPHDITEINGADSLYESTGIIAESELIASKLFGAGRTLYSCSGSTLVIQAMLGLVKTKTISDGKSRIAAYRYAHRSFVSAAALLDLEVDWIYPNEFFSAILNTEAVRFSLKSDTAAVFINSIDYYGGMCNIKDTALICDKAGIPLLADNAQGAYLVLTERHPNKLGAAMTADSAHKTLPAMTGAAYLHINDERFIENAKAMTALFGTSSPSYLILESLDLCNKYIAGEKGKHYEPEAFGLVAALKKDLEGMGFALKENDFLRITVNARDYGYTGVSFSDELRKNGVECEYADENYAVLLFSSVTRKEETQAVKDAFRKAKRKKALPVEIYPVLKPKRAMSIREALFSPDEDCSFLSPETAIGRICAEINTPCPPGIPLIMPGEIIGVEEAELLIRFGVKRVRAI